MSLCLGCGLTVDATTGMLSTQLCPNGGISCATITNPAPDGCTSGLYVQFPANPTGTKPTNLGCGLNSDADGKLFVDTCTNSGLACGDTNDDTSCLYANVQGQGAGAAVAIGTAQTSDSPNCNGLVRTDSGLWSPPKNSWTIGLGNNQDAFTAGSNIGNYVWNGGSVEDVDANVGDGFAGPLSSDSYFSSLPANNIFYHVVESDPCKYLSGSSHSTFNISYLTQGRTGPGAGQVGDLWRWLLWERVGFVANTTTTLVGTGWALQASFYNDRRTQDGNAIVSVQMNDVSSFAIPPNGIAGKPFLRLEYMITVNRIAGSGTINDNVIAGGSTRQYRIQMVAADGNDADVGTGGVNNAYAG